MPYLQYLGLDGGRRELSFSNGTSLHTWGTILHTIPLPTLQIPWLCTVCDREIYWYLWNSQRISQDTWHNNREYIYLIVWTGTIPTKYQVLGKDSPDKSPSFFIHLLQLGISLIGALAANVAWWVHVFGLCNHYVLVCTLDSKCGIH